MRGINGIAKLVYGVEDVPLCTRYFDDFGLPLIAAETSDVRALFELDEGSCVELLPLEAAVTPGQRLEGYGVQKVIWGVENQRNLDRYVARLQRVTDVTIDDDGTAHFLDCDGIAMALQIYNKILVQGAPDPVNSLNNIQRLNQHRKWRLKANPKTIQHAVFMVDDPDASWAWYQQHLDFLLSDIQEGFGIFARAPGTYDHHNMYWLRNDLPFPGVDGKVRFHHANFGVEDIDELMVGTNYMQRKGWPRSEWGFGRHRIASSAYMYLPCPAGGEAEYGTDSDMLDAAWVPRRWNARFGTASFMHEIPPFMMDDSVWDTGFVEGCTPVHDPDDS